MVVDGVILSKRADRQLEQQIRAELHRLRVLRTQVQQALSDVQDPQLICGKASGTITARSGDTFGTGSMQVYVMTHGSDTWADAGYFITVKNASSEISDGTWCSALQELSGAFIVAPLDCP